MNKSAEIGAKALAAVRSESRVGPHFKPVLLSVDEVGVATIQADVDNVAIKKLVLERIAGTPGISGILDRVRVKPSVPMSDDGILDHLLKAYYGEPSLQQITLKQRERRQVALIREGLPGASGEIEIEVHDGVVILNGNLASLAAKRLAGVLAWWVPGSRDVINGIIVEPPEQDAPIAIEEGVRIALEKDPLFDASQIRVGVRNRTVRLTAVSYTHLTLPTILLV